MQRALLLPVDSAAPVTATVTQQVESLLPHLSLLLAIPGLSAQDYHLQSSAVVAAATGSIWASSPVAPS
jgi:hypothetical protein